MREILLTLIQVASIIFIIRALISWIRISSDSPFYPVVRAIYQITEPVLGPLRRVIPPLGGLDLSVILVVLVLNYVIRPLVSGSF